MIGETTMDGLKKERFIIVTISIAIVLCFCCFLLGYLCYKEPKLGEFRILGITEEIEGYYLEIEKSHHALAYEVEVVDDEKNVILETESKTTKILLNHFLADYGTHLTINVTAKNKNGTKKKAVEPFKYVWQKASFKNMSSHYIDAKKGLSLLLVGYQQNETYRFTLEYLNETIYEEAIMSDNIYIPYQKLEGYAGRITAKLYTEKNCLISVSNFYVNTPVIGKVKMISPNNGLNTRWNDISFTFEGGTNATAFYFNIYEEGQKKDRIELPVNTKEYILPAEYLNEEKNYYFEIEAAYLDYEEISEKSGIEGYIGKKETTEPVYTSHNPSFIKKGTKITLGSRTRDATIYYTLDGSEPNESSFVYRKPLSINENTIVKAKAVSKRRYDSETNTYDFQIGEKELVVYLSPSNQSWNYGNAEAGYTTEMREMNKLTDILETMLKEKGVTVYRNKSSHDINTHLSESNAVKSDLHLAIHSNASLDQEARGIEIYVDKPTSKSLSIATNIYQNLYAIYPNKNSTTDRGVKYANGSLGEANDHFIPCGTLIEIAYHDNYEDAKWILEKKEQIASSIASAIISYYK